MKLRSAVVLACVALSTGAAQADRYPVAVLWLGDPDSLAEGQRVADEVNSLLLRSQVARPLDSTDHRRILVEGGPLTQAARLQARGEAALAKLRLADAVRDLESAERLLLTEVPMDLSRSRLADIERSLLLAYDQQGRPADAQRAAARLAFTPGTSDDVKALMDKHHIDRSWDPARAPVRIVTEPPGATVYRNLVPVGPSPVEVPGGDPEIDFIDVELPGYRRVHLPLGGAGGDARVVLEREERLGSLVDALHTKLPSPPAKDVADLGRRVGAARVLAIAPDGDKLLADWVDVGKESWSGSALRVDPAGDKAMGKLAQHVAPAPAAAPAAAITATKAPPPPKKSKWGAWGKWYTWVAAGGVVVLIGALLIAQSVGEDNVHVVVEK
jgi:hypothetical protein